VAWWREAERGATANSATNSNGCPPPGLRGREACRQPEPQGVSAPWPSDDDRAFVEAVNKIAVAAKSPGFGETGVAMNSNLARGGIQFSRVAAVRWPDLGEPLTTPMPGAPSTPMIDPSCSFWMAGHALYIRALARYISALGDVSKIGNDLTHRGRSPDSEALHRGLLTDLGVYVYEDFVSESEEAELFAYWGPGSLVHRKGSQEQGSRRRFFHYGPVLQLQARDSVKSTLGIIPGRLGAMPPLVERMQLRERLRERSKGLGDRSLGMDQLYVNWYSRAARSRIDFHHDNPKAMGPVIAGVSLCSACEFQFVALDRELPQNARISVTLPRRSLILLSGLSRYHLQHGIPMVKQDRLSLTFRTLERDCADRALWRREWSAFPSDEAANAHWPLLPPE